MKALWKSDAPAFLPLPPMLTNAEAELLRQNKLLRDHVARLVSTNVALLQQIETLSRERGRADRLAASPRQSRTARAKG